MENKQLFTKVAVSILIGLNVGAYYVFWPHQDGGAKPAAKKRDEDKGQTKLLPTKADPTPTKVEQPTPKPAELPSLTSVPLSIPNPKKAEFSPDEAVNKLLDHIKREKVGEKDLPPAIPMFPEDAPKPAVDKNVGITSPLTPKVPQGPWQLQTKPEKVGGSTLVIAKLRDLDGEFQIYCDRFNIAPDGSKAEARGLVIVNSTHFSARCKCLTLLLGEPRLIFEDQVNINRPGTNEYFTSERVVWDFPPMSVVPARVLGPPK